MSMHKKRLIQRESKLKLQSPTRLDYDIPLLILSDCKQWLQTNAVYHKAVLHVKRP